MMSSRFVSAAHAEGFYAIEIEIDLRELMVRMGKRRRLCYAHLAADNPRRKRNILRFMHIQLPQCNNFR